MRAIIVLWILITIVALVVLLLHFSVKAYVSLDGEGFDLKVKFLFFTVYPRPEKKKKTNKKTKLKKNKTKNKKNPKAATIGSAITRILRNTLFLCFTLSF